jgi:hypothetical protein
MAAMSVRRRAVAGAMLVAGTLGVGVLCWPHPAVAQEPDIAAWWNAANVGDPAPAPPPPPDVNPGDLLVQGSNTVPTPGAPVTSAPGSAQAVAGLAFDLHPTDVVGALTLGVDGSAPPQVSVVACRATEHFTNVENGAWSRAPAYDANACTPGALKDGKVVFADISKLVQDAQLALVLLPGPVDRVVFAKPGADALEVTHAGSLGAGAPSFGSGTGGGGSSAAFGGGAAAPAAGDAGAPAAPELPPTTSTSTGADLAPVVAGSSPPAPASTAGATTAAAASASGLSTTARRWLALVIIALEVVGFAALRRVPEVSPLPATAAAAAAGGRLRPPDRTPAGSRAGRSVGATIGGVGRFRRERHGAAPPV